MVILELSVFEGNKNNVGLGIMVNKGNTELKDDINNAISGMGKSSFDSLMDSAVKIMPS
jgi:ABC-type amino acid transport substrate-binding protein